MREQELLDLGMKIEPVKREDPKGIYKQVERIRDEQKSRQVEYEKQMIQETANLKQMLYENEGPDIREQLLQERHGWIIDFYEKNHGKALPKNVDELYEIYEKMNVGVPLTPE